MCTIFRVLSWRVVVFIHPSIVRKVKVNKSFSFFFRLSAKNPKLASQRSEGIDRFIEISIDRFIEMDEDE